MSGKSSTTPVGGAAHARTLLLERLEEVTLAQLAEDFDERYRVAMLP